MAPKTPKPKAFNLLSIFGIFMSPINYPGKTVPLRITKKAKETVTLRHNLIIYLSFKEFYHVS